MLSPVNHVLLMATPGTLDRQLVRCGLRSSFRAFEPQREQPGMWDPHRGPSHPVPGSLRFLPSSESMQGLPQCMMLVHGWKQNFHGNAYHVSYVSPPAGLCDEDYAGRLVFSY